MQNIELLVASLEYMESHLSDDIRTEDVAAALVQPFRQHPSGRLRGRAFLQARLHPFQFLRQPDFLFLQAKSRL